MKHEAGQGTWYVKEAVRKMQGSMPIFIYYSDSVVMGLRWGHPSFLPTLTSPPLCFRKGGRDVLSPHSVIVCNFLISELS